MKIIQFRNGTDPSVAEVLSPFSGQLPRIHRFPMTGTSRIPEKFTTASDQLIKIARLGYSLETLAFSVCGIASFTLLLMAVLRML